MKNEIKRTLQIAAPLILGNITQMALSLIDTAMVGAIDYKQLAAAALVTNLLAIPYVMGIGLTTALTPLIAIANGKGNKFEASRYLYNGVILCTIISVFIALGLSFSEKIVFNIGQDPIVAALSIPYLKIMGWSVIPMIFFLSLKQFCDALEQTKVAMFLSLISMPINVLLNWIMIYGNWGFPRMELEGAGWATLISRILIAIALLWVVLTNERFKEYIDLRKEAWKINLVSFVQILKLGIPSGLQFGLEVGAFAISGIMIGWFGATQQAAHQIALNIASFTFMIIMGLSTAGSIRISNALGRGNILQMRNIGLSTLTVGLAYGFITGLLFIIFHNYLPLIFNQNTEVVSLAAHLLIFAAIFQISDSTQAIGIGLLRGMKDVTIPTVSVIIAYWVIGLPLGYYLGVKYDMKATGMWIGLVIGLTVSSILLNIRFHTHTKKMLAEENLSNR
ncbi:MAG TPA: MATE family efflux transporter [Chitinophagales bacterium]|nr:MATE family efflux transporter [Chitinophagales bacterium]